MNFAKLYANNCLVQRMDAGNYLNRFSNLIKWKPYKENILDVGCGDGFVTRQVLFPFAKNHIEKICAVDLAETMIEHAKQNHGIKEIEFKIMDITSDNCPKEMENKFDHIFSFNCAPLVLDQRALMKRFYQLLKPDGQIFVTSLVTTPIHKTFIKFHKEEKWSKFWPKTTSALADYKENPAEYMKEILEENKFDVHLSLSESRNGISDDYPDFVKSLALMHRFINAIPKELQEEYLQDFIKTACGFCTLLERPGRYNWPYESLIFVATKM